MALIINSAFRPETPANENRSSDPDIWGTRLP